MNLQQQKENLEYTIAQLQEQLNQINEEIKAEEMKEMKAKEVKASPKAKFFFKVGEKHPIFYRTKDTEVMEVLEINLEKNIVIVDINGARKKFIAEPIRNKDNKITTFAVVVDKRTQNRVLANSKF